MALLQSAPVIVAVVALAAAGCGSGTPEQTSNPSTPATPPQSTSVQPDAQQAAPSVEYQIRGVVFEDRNQNRTLDAADVRVAQQTVVLTDRGRLTQFQQTTTAADGTFHFDNLEPREYRVTLMISEGFKRTTDDSVVFELGREGTEILFGVAAAR